MQRVISIIAVLLVTMACSNTKETPKGYKFQLVKAGDGAVVETGQVLVLDLCIKDAKDSLWYDNRKTAFPDLVLIQDTSHMKDESGVAEIFRMMSKGDSIHFAVTAQELFERTYRMTVPPNVDPKSMFTYVFKVRDVIDSTEANKRQAEFMLDEKRQNKQRIDEGLARQAEAPEVIAQLRKDSALIVSHLKKNNIDAQRLSTGVYYVIKNEGDGATAETGDVAYVKYSGYLLNGKVFDSGTYPVNVGEYGVIAGWEQVIPLMKKGTSLTVFVPSTWAYGTRAMGPDIKENSVLAFDMELIDLKKPF